MRNLREYLWAKSPNDALRLRGDRPGRGAFLGGGTALAARQDPELDFVVDLSEAGLGRVREREISVEIGATVPLQALIEDPCLRSWGSALLSEAARRTRTEPWRRQATVVGRLLERDPADLLAPCLLALGARLCCLRSPEATPEPLDLETALAGAAAGGSEALITAIEIPRPEAGWGFALETVSRSALDSPLAAAAVGVRVSDGSFTAARVATAALPAPRRARRVEAALRGCNPEAIEPALAALSADIEAPDDWRASAAYRANVAGVLLARALCRAAARSLEG